MFKGIWSLEDYGVEGAEVTQVVERALQNPHDFVLKPQKEGGGNNFFDEELKQKLQILKAKEATDPALDTLLIMERIRPPMIPAFLVHNGELKRENSMSEFGFFSAVLTRNGPEGRQTIKNEVIGTLMRTKASHFNEGGVNAGYSFIDQPLVVPSDVFNAENAPYPTLGEFN